MTVNHLTLIRHGETRYTAEQRFCGSDDPDLTASGTAAAEALAALPALRGAQLLLSSPSLRARRTAAPLAASLRLAITVDAAFAETRFGAWEGCPYTAVRETPAYRAWVADPALRAPPGGESGFAVQRRAAAALTGWIDIADHIVLVSHKGTIRLLYSFFAGLPAAEYRALPNVPPGSISRLRLRGGHLVEAVLGETDHLAPHPADPITTPEES